MTWFTNCPPIAQSFGTDKLNDLPILDIGSDQGMTGYIDFIQVSDMTEPIMKGLDKFKRPFLAILFKVKHEGEIKHAVATFFQRYSDEKINWAYGTCYDNHMSIYDNSRLRLDDYENLTKRLKLLLTGDEPIYAYASGEDYDGVYGGNKECEIFL